MVQISYQGTPREIAENMERSRLLYSPLGDFAIVTAQPTLGNVRGAIRTMVEKLFPNCSNLLFVSGSRDQVINAKVSALRNLQAREYTDNDTGLIDEIRLRIPELSYYTINNGVRLPYIG